ncbi:hypothetical protein Tco_1098802 [Tanacetum coccineum]
MSNTNNNLQTQTLSALYNAIMEAGGKDRPPLLTPGNYYKWIPNPTLDTPDTDGGNQTHPERVKESYVTVSEEIKKKIDAESEAVQIILIGIDNDIYSTVDACPNAMEMWKAIERLKQGDSINVQDLETSLFWELGKFTSRDGKTLDSYYSQFYKMMNELVRNQCIVTNHQNEVNEIRAERLARTTNPLSLVAQHQSVYQPQTNPTNYTHSSSTRSQATTRNNGKAITNSPPPTYDPEPEDEACSKEKEIDKLMTLILITNKGTGYDRQTGQYDNQRAVNVVEARENVGTQVVQQTGIQCFSCKEFRHVARECKKEKRPKDLTYHKENMLLCKKEEVGIQLSVEQADWRDDSDDEPEDHELEAHYMYMAKVQEVIPKNANNSGPIFDTKPFKKVHTADGNYNVFANERQHPEQHESINNIYVMEQDDKNISPDSSNICSDEGEADQDDDLEKECALLTSSIKKLKCEMDENKKRNKSLETSNKAFQ